MKQRILSIGDGRTWDKWKDQIKCTSAVVTVDCVDQFFKKNEKYSIMNNNSNPSNSINSNPNNNINLIGKDIFDYLLEYPRRDYNKIVADRVFEHIHYEKIPFLLYLLKEVSTPTGTLTIVVPDFEKVGEHIKKLGEINNPLDFNKAMIDVHTELFNEKYDPHQSIWTPWLANYYIHMENYWKVERQTYKEIDNRDWYLSIECRKNDSH